MLYTIDVPMFRDTHQRWTQSGGRLVLIDFESVSIVLCRTITNILSKLASLNLINPQRTANSHEFQGVLFEFRAIFRRLKKVQSFVKECTETDTSCHSSLGIGEYHGVAAQILRCVK